MRIFKIFLIIVLFFLCSDVFGKNICGYDIKKRVLFFREGLLISSFEVGLAVKNENFLKGLMFCERFDFKKGLLFIYPSSRSRSFWMKNTSIPLSIIFISPGKKIISLKKGVPFKLTPLSEEKPVKFVLEINHSDSSRLKPGDSIIIENI